MSSNSNSVNEIRFFCCSVKYSIKWKIFYKFCDGDKETRGVSKVCIDFVKKNCID